jgi:hypothetical protein
MSTADLVARLRDAGDPLHVLAADALVACYAEVERLRARALLLEAVARLNGETIRAMQEAARQRSTLVSDEPGRSRVQSFAAMVPL